MITLCLDSFCVSVLKKRPSAAALSISLFIGVIAVEARAEAFPTYNFDTYCRKLSGGDFEKDLKCGEKEGAAHSKLEKIWASVPEGRKVDCRNVAYDANTGAGSYALHLRCIEKGRK